MSYNKRICGILGSIHLIGGDYLIVATHRLYVGIVQGAIIWRLAGFDILPYIPTNTHLRPEQRKQNEKYLDMLRKTLCTQFFYFSYWYDLTHTQQRLHGMPQGFLKVDFSNFYNLEYYTIYYYYRMVSWTEQIPDLCGMDFCCAISIVPK